MTDTPRARVSPVLAFRPLESRHFGVPVHAAAITTAAQCGEVLALASSLSGALLVLRVPADTLPLAQRLEAGGARLCDALVTLQGRHLPQSDAPTPHVIRRGTRDDAAALRLMATAAFDGTATHWHADPRITPSLASLLYGAWAADLARETTDTTPLYIAEAADGGIAGFLAMRQDHESGHWSVPLTAVDGRARGGGILGALLDAAAREAGASGPSLLHYETQLGNSAALRATSRRGMVPVSARFTFHLWVDA